MENTLFSIEKGRAMEGAMEDRPSTHTLTMIFGRELWRMTYGGKKILHRILQKTPSMEINKRPQVMMKYCEYFLSGHLATTVSVLSAANK